MLGRGCLFGLLGVLAGLAALGEVADVGARHLATSKVEERVHQQVPEASGVHARIRSWPFLKVGVSGDIDEITATATRVVERPLVFTDVTVDLRGVRISVTDLVTNAGVNVTRIRRGTVSAAVSVADIQRALPPALAGQAFTVTVDSAKRALVIGAHGLGSVSLALPGTDILPCTPQVVQTPTEVELSCTFTTVPAAFTTAATG